MIDAIFQQLGASFLVPAILVLVAGWGVRVFMDMHASTRQRRREFMEVWRTLDREDDLSVEIAIRHLTGAFLPARVIHAVLSLPMPAERLFQLAATWDHLTFDSETMTLRATRPALHHPTRRRGWQFALTAGYFVFALTSLVLLRSGIAGSPTELLSWMLVLIAFACGMVALACLARADKLGEFGRWSVTELQQITATIAPRRASQFGGCAP